MTRAARKWVALFGHVTAAVPFLAFVFMRQWLSMGIYNDDLYLIGPRWWLKWGGEEFARTGIVACVLFGIVGMLLGVRTRRVSTILEGGWCVMAAFPLWFYLGFATF